LGRVLAVLALVAAGLTAGDASARTIRRSCRDGADAHPVAQGSRSLVACDVSAPCDGVCAFEMPVCGPESCETETLAVPAGSIRRERLAVSPGAAPVMLVLRCRPTARATGCVSVTTTSYTTTTGGPTTTGVPQPPGMTTTTRVRLGRASTTSSTTIATTSSTVTTTTIVIPSRIPCSSDNDCDGLATACAVGFCADTGFCAQLCVCLTPDLAPTCAETAAKGCLAAGECFGAADTNSACRVCYLNVCRRTLLADCFPELTGQSPSFTIDFGVGGDGGFTFGGSFGSMP
jgi:hypothetical protein